MTYDEMKRLASVHRVEVVARLDKAETKREWISEVENWIDREGCVVRLADGRQFKVKSDRYRMLHRAVEGPHRDRARWSLWSQRAGDQLRRVSAKPLDAH
ncbi:MAG: hypothetical protein R3C05_19370 [Pirellulaceae bacterium]